MSDFVGDDNDQDNLGDDFLGAAAQRMQIPRAKAPSPRANVSANRIKGYMGLGSFVLDDTNQTDQLEVEPTREFAITRVVIEEVKSADGVGGILLITGGILVDDLPQCPNPGDECPASLFRPDATESDVQFQVAKRKVTINFATTVALAMGESISVSGGCYGYMVRGS